MIKSNNLLVFGTAFVALIVSIIAAVHQPETLVTQPADQHQAYGALTGPDIASPYLKWGGIATYNASPAISATSSVVCAIQAPPATSTLSFASVRIDTNGLGSQVLYISTSSVVYGSSTPALISAASIASGNTGRVIVWTPSIGTTSPTGAVLTNFSNDGEMPYVVAPNQYVTFRVATTTPGTFAGGYLAGECKAEFTPI